MESAVRPDATLGPAEVLQRLSEAFNAGDLQEAMSYIAADAVNHGPPPTASLQDWHQRWVGMRTAFPDLNSHTQQVLEGGDTACRRLTISGTNTGGDAPTGRRFEVLGMDMVRVRDGKLVEHWALLDTAGMAAQLKGAAQ
jgi:predicted ester cyclase